ncbi:MAG: tRNA pseudouridine(38-40) synthase TruA [Planctomycetaceae bacterium]|nr:tRNA pseudouridine(38-40) synthase TruA [Planctomycetaceae bacterium]
MTEPQSTPEPTVHQRNVMLRIAYRGTNYCGWQIQPNGPSIQQHLEAAIEKLTRSQTRILCAGRTDSGVHAVGQVASFRTESQIPCPQMMRGLQAFLPDDIIILHAQDVASQFHATFSAERKRYRYVMQIGAHRSPFLNELVHRLRYRPDVAAMQQACSHLLGTHDFRCFESHFPNKATSVRTIQEAGFSFCGSWNPWDPLDVPTHQLVNHASAETGGRTAHAEFLVFDIMADGFLYNMVRAIVGTLLDVGTRKQNPQWMQQVIESRDRSRAGMTAPACGLYLVHVEYPQSLLQPELSR